MTLAQMADHLKRSEAELGELLAEYWALRNRTCERTDSQNVIKWLRLVHGSRIYGDYSQETGDAGLFCLNFQQVLLVHSNGKSVIVKRLLVMITVQYLCNTHSKAN